MPAFNAAPYLRTSVQSVTQQTYQSWELLVADDASQDDTLRIALELSCLDHRIKVVPLPRNGGVALARNAAIERATGEYLAFLDSDDQWLPEKLQVQTEYMKSTGAAFSFTSYRRVRGEGVVGPAVAIPDMVDYESLLKGNVIGCLTVMIDRCQIAPFKMPKIGHEDYATWLSILRSGHKAWGLQRDLARYRVSPGSVSGNKGRSATWTWRIYRELEHLSLAESAVCFINYSVHGLRKHFGG
jgi:teichuronic acid biosynthesis glycosyltransferase TuaG